MKEKYKNRFIYVYLNRVYDAGNYVHPGGDWILYEANFNEISRYLLGTIGMESCNSKAWWHSKDAFALMEDSWYIGDLYEPNTDQDWIIRNPDMSKAAF